MLLSGRALAGVPASVREKFTTVKHVIEIGDEVSKGHLGYSALVEKESSELARVDISGDDLAFIFYTSGTTGPPKGAMISHFNYLNTGHVWATDLVEFRQDDIFFTTLPLFHANAQMFTTMGSLRSGRPFVLRERFSA